MEGVKQASAQGGRIWGDPARSRARPTVPAEIDLQRVQGVWNVELKQLGEGWRP
jgi:hypothetical protein